MSHDDGDYWGIGRRFRFVRIIWRSQTAAIAALGLFGNIGRMAA
jgi:hypothetical protein